MQSGNAVKHFLAAGRKPSGLSSLIPDGSRRSANTVSAEVAGMTPKGVKASSRR
ncbi:MAG: DUF1584 domain-containing protein [Phycisphaera sp. RhM]|nr:DUF1584 domain-containing protein [Phycisphaera sp. RhM]